MLVTKESLCQSLSKLQCIRPHITVIGDLILDEYLIGHPERISREAPVLILEYKENYYRLGGAANAAINAASLGADVTLIGTVGEDEASQRMAEICRHHHIYFQPLVLEKKPTTLKTRILSTNQSSSLAHNGTSFSQQVLRIDRQSRKALSSSENEQLLKIIQQNIKKTELLLLSDYSLGVLNKNLVERVIQDSPVKVVVDPSGDFERFKGAYLITPNEPDTEKELGKELQLNSPAELQKIRKQLQQKLSAESSFLITRGAEGMVLLQEKTVHRLPAFNKAEVFDVTGAGDTVSACISVALAAGVSLPEAMGLGNLAASIVVRKAGSATTNYSEMMQILGELPEIKEEVFSL